MPYVGNEPAEKYTSLARQTFSSPTGTSFTLDHSVTNSDDLLLYINNVKQDPADYTASGTSLTTPTLVSGDEMYALFYGRATETVNPPDSSVSSAKLANDAVTTAKIADSTVTNAKVASNAGIDYSKLSLGNASRASLSADQTLTTGTTTKMQFNTEDYDVGGDYDASTNYRYTVGSGDAGKYLIYAALNAAPSDAKRIRVYLYKNGSQLDPPGYQSNNQSVAGNFLSVTTFAILELADADYIEIYGSHNEGSNLDVQSEYSSFIVARLD